MKDLKHIKLDSDGDLMASSFQLATCENCPCAHFVMEDQHGKPFAQAAIPPDQFRSVAAFFLEAATAHELKAGTRLS